MEFDPICNRYFTNFECCSTAGKVVVINYYNLSKEWIRTEYVLPDGTRTDVVPDGLDCSCDAVECLQITSATHSNLSYQLVGAGVAYNDIITLDGTPPIGIVENAVPVGLTVTPFGPNAYRVSGSIADPGNYDMDLMFTNCDGTPFNEIYAIRVT